MICMRFYHTDSLTMPYLSPTKILNAWVLVFCLKSLEITFLKDPILALPGDGVRIGHTGREKFDLEPKALQWS